MQIMQMPDVSVNFVYYEGLAETTSFANVVADPTNLIV